MELDITQTLKDTENSLRDFIAATLEKSIGSEWPAQSGVTPERLRKWQERKEAEGKRQPGGFVESRLIYYADFYDIQTILEKHWGKFSEALGDWKTIRVYLSELEKLRDPDAHRRELLPHQKHLAVGIAGEIRTRLIRYRSKLETSEDYFPRIESARDSLGNIAGGGASSHIFAPQILRPDDVIDFVITASDPKGAPLEYAIQVEDRKWPPIWQPQNTFSVRILECHIGKCTEIVFYIKGTGPHHALSDRDDSCRFFYTVLPQKT